MRLPLEMAVLHLSGILKPEVRKNNYSIAYHNNDVLKNMSKNAEKEYYVKKKQSDW